MRKFDGFARFFNPFLLLPALSPLSAPSPLSLSSLPLVSLSHPPTLTQAQDSLHKLLRDDSQSQAVLAEQTEGVRHPDLKDILPYGFAIHHAGMHRNDRALVEGVSIVHDFEKHPLIRD